MSYQLQADLAADGRFRDRCRACLTVQSVTFRDDGRPPIAALASALLTGAPAEMATFLNLLAAAPGFAEMAETEEGTVDQSRIGDPDLLAAAQSGFPMVAELFFTDDGNRIERSSTP